MKYPEWSVFFCNSYLPLIENIRKAIIAQKADKVNYFKIKNKNKQQIISAAYRTAVAENHRFNINDLKYSYLYDTIYYIDNSEECYATHVLACPETARRFLYGNAGEVCFNAVGYARFSPSCEDLYSKYNLDKWKNIDFLRIDFRGTADGWKEITKISGWNSDTGEYTVYCIDGNVRKDGTVISD